MGCSCFCSKKSVNSSESRGRGTREPGNVLQTSWGDGWLSQPGSSAPRETKRPGILCCTVQTPTARPLGESTVVLVPLRLPRVSLQRVVVPSPPGEPTGTHGDMASSAYSPFGSLTLCFEPTKASLGGGSGSVLLLSYPGGILVPCTGSQWPGAPNSSARSLK